MMFLNQTYGYQGRNMGGSDKLGDWDWHTHTTIYKLDNQQGPTVEHRELYSIFCNNLYGKSIFKNSGYMYMYNWSTLLLTWN